MKPSTFITLVSLLTLSGLVAAHDTADSPGANTVTAVTPALPDGTVKADSAWG